MKIALKDKRPMQPSCANKSTSAAAVSVIIGCLLLAACGGGSGDSDGGANNGGNDNIVPPAEPKPKPNILLVMVDDLGFNDLAINNDNTAIHTPNLDQLARDGVRFTRHYAHAVCSPARASLLTGQYSERLGYLPAGRGISPDVTTLPEQLQSLGYNTWHVGKWHIGDLQPESRPENQGFDHWFGFLRMSWLAGRQENGELAMTRPRYEDPWLEGDDLEGKHYQGHLENILTNKALEVISSMDEEEQPWFLNLWYYAPHSPISPAAEFASQYPDNAEGEYRALVHQLDSNIGRVIAHLESLGALQNTIVVVVSDNGGTNRELNNNAPYFGAKGSLHEGGVRTPLIIRWPDGSINGQVISDTVTIRDIYPTLLASIGSEDPAKLDGKSFYNRVKGLEAPLERELFWDSISSYSALSQEGRWKMLWPLYFPVMTIYDMEQDPTGSQPTQPIPQPQLDSLLASYETWYRDVHQVNTNYLIDAQGVGSLQGQDMLRTPGFGDYTFGMAISDNHIGQLVNQPGVWSMSRTGNIVTAQLGDWILSGALVPIRDCHSVIVSGTFYRSITWFGRDSSADLQLYLDGVLVDSIQMEGVLDVTDISPEIFVGDPDLSQPSEPIQAPVILNIAVAKSPVWTPESFSEELCPAGVLPN